MNNRIACHNLDTFIAVCAGLVREGITFHADASTLTVTTTGGF